MGRAKQLRDEEGRRDMLQEEVETSKPIPQWVKVKLGNMVPLDWYGLAAKHILATQNPPVDPDEVTAREIVAAHYERSGLPLLAKLIRAGKRCSRNVAAITAALKKAREEGVL